ncbi:MAG: hypothetical protein R2747_22860 [Pyrinomonadaceae bacterium]
MSKLYNNAFKVGVLVNLWLFTALNLYSYYAAYRGYWEYLDSDVKFCPGYSGFSVWGFPFSWNEKYFQVIEGGGGILNFLVLTIAGFATGFLFRFIWSKISAQKLKEEM